MSTIKSSDEHLTLNADGSSKDIKFQANGVEKASISSSGAFTSTTIDATKLTGDLPAISGASLTGIASSPFTEVNANNFTYTTATNPALDVIDSTNTVKARFQAGNTSAVFGSASDHSVAFIQGASENTRMTIDTNGQVGIGAAPISQSELSVTQTNGGHWVSKMVHTSTDAPMLLLQNAMNSGSFGNSHIEFLINNGTTVGTIKCSNSATQYNTSSDYRLKENVDYTWDATTRLKQLKPARFNFIVDNTKTVDGFIAHEVSSVVPEAISGEKDAVDDDGNAVHQGIDQSKLVPLLVKTIQELEARITALEA